MTETIKIPDFALPYEFTPNPEAMETLVKEKEAYDQDPERSGADFKLIHALVDAATSSRQNVAPSDKPTIVIDGADNIDIDANCIDAALSQLDAASRVGLKTNAMMNRSHASIVVDLGHNIWHIDGKSKDDARPENVMLNSTLSRQNTLRIKQCLGLMRSAEHCHAWTDYTTMRRGYTPFNGTNVREPELIPTEVADTLVGDLPDKLLIDSFVLFSNPAARDILRIIDAVTALSKEPKSDDEPTKVRSHYIRALKSFVPKPPVR